MYDENDFLQLSGIQHYIYCKRQWALIHIEGKWQDNYLTTDGELKHSRVHDNAVKTSRDGFITIRGLNIKSYEMGVCGICDAVEFRQSENGVSLNKKNGLWSPTPIEYKRGRTKICDCDRYQVIAQAMCLEEMFKCDVDAGCIFYYETRRREKFLITKEMKDSVAKIFSEMHMYYNRGYTPRAKQNRGCNACSLKNECMPQLNEGKISISEYLNRTIGDMIHETHA